MNLLAEISFGRRALLVYLLLATFTFAGAQTVTLDLNNASVEDAFKAIRKQTGYSFIYTRDQLQGATPVTVKLNATPLAQALDACFHAQPFSWHLEEKYIVIKEKTKPNEATIRITVIGTVLSENGEPLSGAVISAKENAKAVLSSESGTFTLGPLDRGVMITISFTGYKTRQVAASTDPLTIPMEVAVKTLDETHVVAYGTTTKRISTGSVTKVSAEEIAKQPVSNPLATLQGRVPGMTVTQTGGIPGAAIKVQVRGRTSINDNINNDPLFIIDGIPFAPGNTSINQASSALGATGLSPFNTINPSDIESIEVLKDADATAIYGSRGANGVVLITTKKGQAGKTKVSANLQQGFSRITRSVNFLDTRQYLQIRREAFANDGLVPNNITGSTGYAPDLMIWDTTRYTDFNKMLIGGTAAQFNAQLSVSGGNARTQFLVGTSFNRQTTVFPGDLSDTRASLHASINHSSGDHKFSLAFKASYSFDDDRISASDLTVHLKLSPNLPALYDSLGKLNWQGGGVSFENPMAYSLRRYNAKSDNLITSLQLNAQLGKGLTAKLNTGINSLWVDDLSTLPIASQNPALAPLGSASFGTNQMRSFIIEPQLTYKTRWNRWKLDALAGATWQVLSKEGSLINGNGYTSDALLESMKAATSITIVRSDNSKYKYAAAFGRLTLNYADRYILNLSGRRDGSSRFGPGRQYANFGAAGLAWIFSKETFMKDLHWLNHAKLRASYGTTGNDKIGDYAFLNTYSATGLNYQGSGGITPTALFNPDYAWELNKKFEAALETSVLKDKLQVSLAWYSNRSSNQLVNYALPSQVGAQSIIANFPATVRNAGWEAELTTTFIDHKKFSWASSFNITLPENKLVSFPNFESSSYFSYLVLGAPLNITGGYRSAGVNAQTGLLQFYDADGKITSTPTTGRVKDLIKTDPDFYGGLSNTFRFQQFKLDIFLEFKKQLGVNYLGNIYGTTIFPGLMYNQPLQVLNRWQNPGDMTDIQKLTTRSGTAAYNAANIIRNSGSDRGYSDASYIRVKNISLSCVVAEKLRRRIHAENVEVYLSAQNFWTITSFEGSDPETQDIYRLPLLKTIAAGIRLTF